VVEFGCGTGFYTDTLAGKSDRVMATDLSPGMLDVARTRVRAMNVTFQPEDCQRTSFPDGSFDTAFMSLVIHFTEPREALREMHRILKPGGTLIVTNLDPGALGGLSRLRFRARMLYQGITGYRTKPPKGFGSNILTEKQLRDLLGDFGFEVTTAETIRDPSRASNVPVEYVKARKLPGTSA
jgi:ABC-2 type transport system ATP-binding protein